METVEAKEIPSRCKGGVAGKRGACIVTGGVGVIGMDAVEKFTGTI